MKQADRRKYQRNITALTVHLAFSKRITAPILMPFYRALGLSYTQIGILSSLTWWADSSLEVFGGAFSDVYGRKRTSLLYALLGMTCMALFALGHSFIVFALANITYGIALAIGSGNASSLLYDTLHVLGWENQYKKYRGRIQFPPKVLNGLVLLIIPLLYQQQLRYPFWLGLGFYVLSFMTALFITEPPRADTIHFNILSTVKNAWQEIISKPNVIIALWREVIFASFILLTFEYFQPLLAIAGLPLAVTGIVYTIARILEGLGSLWMHKVERYGDHILLRANAMLILSLLATVALTKNFWLLIFVPFVSLLDGATDVLLGDVLNKQISSTNRTTIQSTGNMLHGFFFAILLLLAGYASDRFGIQQMFGLAAIVFIASLGTLWFFSKNNKKQSINE